MVVTSLITNNVQNDQFIAKVLTSVEHSTIQTIGCNIFAETVPSALLFSAAISSVVNYYADPSRANESQKLIHLSTVPTADGIDDALMKSIVHALSESSATSHLALEAHHKAASTGSQDVGSIDHESARSDPLPIDQIQNGVCCPPCLQCSILIVHVVIPARTDRRRSQSRHSWARRVRTMFWTAI